jgi:hypothetical protein
MWVSDSSTIVSDDVWNLRLTNDFLGNFTELEAAFFGINSVWLESTLDIVENSEVLIGLLDGDNVHNTKWESVVSSDLSVNLNQTFLILNDLSSLISGKSVLKSLLEENIERDAFSQLVWTWRWSGSVNSLKFTQVPLLWSGNSLYNLSLSFIALFDYKKI